jgi:hypothetical protein
MDTVESNERAKTSLRVASRLTEATCVTNATDRKNAIFRDFALSMEHSRILGSVIRSNTSKDSTQKQR